MFAVCKSEMTIQQRSCFAVILHRDTRRYRPPASRATPHEGSTLALGALSGTQPPLQTQSTRCFLCSQKSKDVTRRFKSNDLRSQERIESCVSFRHEHFGRRKTHNPTSLRSVISRTRPSYMKGTSSIAAQEKHRLSHLFDRIRDSQKFHTSVHGNSVTNRWCRQEKTQSPHANVQGCE